MEAKDEITDYNIYSSLAKNETHAKHKQIYNKLAQTEHKHFLFWKKYTKKNNITPSSYKIKFVLFLRKIFGASFIQKYLEKGENSTIKKYESIKNSIPKKDRKEFNKIIEDEKTHEKEFASGLQEVHIKYISFVVLGLADALVEIAGIHAGSLGIYNSTELTGLAGIVAGAAASISMASAAYAQAKQGFEGSSAVAAAYTGFSYFFSAVVLATPYFLTSTMLVAIFSSLILGIIIIATVSWYNSILLSSNFKKDFFELAGIMIAATIVLLAFGFVIRTLLHITI